MTHELSVRDGRELAGFVQQLAGTAWETLRTHWRGPDLSVANAVLVRMSVEDLLLQAIRKEVVFDRGAHDVHYSIETGPGAASVEAHLARLVERRFDDLLLLDHDPALVGDLAAKFGRWFGPETPGGPPPSRTRWGEFFSEFGPWDPKAGRGPADTRP